MSQPDEQRPEEEEVAEATSEQSDETPDVEGHQWPRLGAEAVADPGKAYKAY
jgi:hypothetical protein